MPYAALGNFTLGFTILPFLISPDSIILWEFLTSTKYFPLKTKPSRGSFVDEVVVAVPVLVFETPPIISPTPLSASKWSFPP